MLKVTPDDRLYDKPHNAILEASTNTGALGLITYLAIYSSIFYVAYISFKKNNINKDILVIF
ncbi:MAG: hypothetical protein PHO23_01595 [Candidatus Pacebacteria bacterium]|nr:hypothetical protein [Candidatus Paceibacterota bacterium]